MQASSVRSESFFSTTEQLTPAHRNRESAETLERRALASTWIRSHPGVIFDSESGQGIAAKAEQLKKGDRDLLAMLGDGQPEPEADDGAGQEHQGDSEWDNLTDEERHLQQTIDTRRDEIQTMVSGDEEFFSQ